MATPGEESHEAKKFRLYHIPEIALSNHKPQAGSSSSTLQPVSTDATTKSTKNHSKRIPFFGSRRNKSQQPTHNSPQMGGITADSIMLDDESSDMGAVKMGMNGTLSIGQLGDFFLWQWKGLVQYGSNEGVFFSLQSEKPQGLYIAADISAQDIVKGMTKQQMADKSNSYWRSREFSKVASGDYDSSWIALQYWGQNRPDDPASLEGYYLVVEGKPPATVFKLADRDTAKQCGAFSFVQ